MDEYTSRLSAALLGVDDKANNRITSFKEKAPAPQTDVVNGLSVLYSASAAGAKKYNTKKVVSRQIPSAPSRILDAPDLKDDYYLNLISWSDKNILAVALGRTVYLWNADTGNTQELCHFEGDHDGATDAHISPVSWV